MRFSSTSCDDKYDRDRLMSRDDPTTAIQACLDRIGDGDGSAREPLIAAASDRLTRLARKMLKGYPGVRRWASTGTGPRSRRPTRHRSRLCRCEWTGT
jgi:hypothetical protein